MGNAKPVVVNHCVLCLSGCVGIMVCYATPVVVNQCGMLSRVCGNHGVLFSASGLEARCECCASRCEPWRVVLKQWLLFIFCYYVPVGVSRGELCKTKQWL